MRSSTKLLLLMYVTFGIEASKVHVADGTAEELRHLEIRKDGRLLNKNEYKWTMEEIQPNGNEPQGPHVWGALHGLKVTKVDLFSERVEANVSLTYSFGVAQFRWNPSEFDNETETNVLTSKLRPPILRGCSNTISLKEADNTDHHSKVLFNGTVSTTRSFLTVSECTMNFEAIPHDSHDCAVCLEFPPDVEYFNQRADKDVIFEGIPNEWNVKGSIKIQKSVDMSTKTRQVVLYFTVKRHADNINWVLRYVTMVTVFVVILVQSKTSYKNIPSYIGMVIINATIIATGEHIILSKQYGWGGNASLIVYAHTIMFAHSALSAFFDLWMRRWNRPKRD